MFEKLTKSVNALFLLIHKSLISLKLIFLNQEYTPSFFIRIIFIRIKAQFPENLRKFLEYSQAQNLGKLRTIQGSKQPNLVE